MSLKMYESDGKYAASHDFQISQAHLLSNVLEDYNAFAEVTERDGVCQILDKWMLDYIETGLHLLGYSNAASLVRTNLKESAKALFEEAGLVR